MRLREWAQHIKRDGVTLWFVYQHPDSPWIAKWASVFVVAYALSPIDLIPDIVPILGYLDDVILLPALIWLTLRLIPSNVLEDCRAKANEWMTMNGKKPRSLLGLCMVLLVWGLITWFLWRHFMTENTERFLHK